MSDLIILKPEQKALDIFKPENLPKILDSIEKEVSLFIPDLKNLKTRKEIASMAYKVSRSKTFLIEKGQELTADWKARAKVVDNQIGHVKARMDKLRDSVREPLRAFEEKEQSRISKCKNKIEEFEKLGNRLFALSLDSKQIKESISLLNRENIDESIFFEFTERALFQRSQAVESLEITLKEVLNKEAEAIELKRLREESNARKIKDHEEKIILKAKRHAQQEAERKVRLEIEKIQAEKEKIQAEKEVSEQKARDFEARKKLEAEATAKKIKKDIQEAAEKAEREKQQAVDLERKRQESIQAAKDREAEIFAEKERVRVAHKEHIFKVNLAIEAALVEKVHITASEAISVLQAIKSNLIPQVKIIY